MCMSCTPGKDHWCYSDKERNYAIKFGCFNEGDSANPKFIAFKCGGDTVVKKTYTDDTCTSEVANGEIEIFTPTGKTKKKNDEEFIDKDTTGTSSCKDGVASGVAGGASSGTPTTDGSPSPTTDGVGDMGRGQHRSWSWLGVAVCLLLAVVVMW